MVEELASWGNDGAAISTHSSAGLQREREDAHGCEQGSPEPEEPVALSKI